MTSMASCLQSGDTMHLAASASDWVPEATYYNDSTVSEMVTTWLQRGQDKSSSWLGQSSCHSDERNAGSSNSDLLQNQGIRNKFFVGRFGLDDDASKWGITLWMLCPDKPDP